jgi:hypothetical protein
VNPPTHHDRDRNDPAIHSYARMAVTASAFPDGLSPIGPPTARGVFLDPSDSSVGEPVAQAVDGSAGDTEFHGDAFILPAVGGSPEHWSGTTSGTQQSTTRQ